MRKKRFIINVFMMSSTMLIIRIAGMISNIYISARLGASAMGIYHMIFAIFSFGITFASSGTGFAATRLIAENPSSDAEVIKKCLIISAVTALMGFGIFVFGAPFIQKNFIQEKSTVNAIRILAFALPCMSASGVYRGYFIAKRKASIITASSLFEEGVCLGVTLLMMNKFTNTSKAYMCLVYGCASSNLAAFLFDSVICLICLKRSVTTKAKASFKAIFAICIPIALGSYLRTALVATENLMIPIQLGKYGISNPIGEYGIIRAMAMSVVLFPTVFIQAFSSMLVPEMSEMNARCRPNGIRYVSSLAISTVMMFSAFIALMLFSHHEVLSRSFFKEPRVSHYMGMLSLLVLPMYLDTVADSILKGLNLQNASLRYNIIDSCMRIIFIFFLLPKFGPVLYIAMLYISEIFNLSLSLGKAAKVTGLKMNWSEFIILPLVSALAALRFSSPVVQALIYSGVYFGLKSLKNK